MELLKLCGLFVGGLVGVAIIAYVLKNRRKKKFPKSHYEMNKDKMKQANETKDKS